MAVAVSDAHFGDSGCGPLSWWPLGWRAVEVGGDERSRGDGPAWQCGAVKGAGDLRAPSTPRAISIVQRTC